MWSNNNPSNAGALGMQQNAQFTDSHDTEIPITFTNESISCLKFAPLNQTYAGFGTPILAAAFWDGSIAIY